MTSLPRPFSNKAPVIQKFLIEIAPHGKQAYETGDTCALCGAKVTIDSFKDTISIKEYGISGMCQACQDKVFTECEE